MFILETDPSWMSGGAAVGSIVFFVSVLLLVVMAILEEKIDKDIHREGENVVLKRKSRIVAFCLYSAVITAALGLISVVVFIVVGLFNSDVETFNNPYSVVEEQREELKVDVDKLETTIVKSIEVDKVEVVKVEEDSTAVLNGDLTDFTAVEDGKLIEGKFYFTEHTLEILVSNESDVIDHVSVPVK